MKYITIKIALLSLLSIIALSSTALAQRTAQILYFKAPPSAPKAAVIYQGDKELQEVKLPRTTFSSTIKLAKGDLVLSFLPKALPEGEALPKGAPSVKIPQTWQNILILAFSDSKNPILPMRFEVINANAGTFGAGDRMMINFSNNQIFGLVGSKKVSLKAKSTQVIKNAAGANKEFQVKLDRIDPDSKKRLPFLRRVWRHSPTRRSLILIYSPPGSNTVTYSSIKSRNL